MNQKTSKKQILVADDDISTIETLNEILGEENDIHCATSGNDAVSLAEKLLPDLILLDIMMPDGNGFEVCKQLKSDIKTASIPVIFLSSRKTVETEEEALTCGAVDFIGKPFSPKIVKLRVDRHMEQKRQRDILEDLSRNDGLTGIPNRRAFNAFLQREWKRQSRLGDPISLIMLDIDHFKAYNDLYGHHAGDECLRQLASTMTHCLCRRQDFVARYGGEEFAFILPETRLEGAMQVANTILKAITKENIKHEKGGHRQIVTASLGVASAEPEKEAFMDSLLERADQALYQAKQAGRNRIIASGELVHQPHPAGDAISQNRRSTDEA